MRSHSTGALARAAALLAAFVAVSWAAGCRQEPEEPVVPRPEKQPDQVIAEFHRTETREGRVVWELRAARGEIFETDHRIDLFRLRVDYYDRAGRRESWLTADSGRVNTGTHDMEARGNVQVENEQGTVLRTVRLEWEERSGRIRSEEEVEIMRQGNRLRGRGFEGDPALEVFTLREQVRATVNEAGVREQDDVGR